MVHGHFLILKSGHVSEIKVTSLLSHFLGSGPLPVCKVNSEGDFFTFSEGVRWPSKGLTYKSSSYYSYVSTFLLL
jgi:hypothetical protein